MKPATFDYVLARSVSEALAALRQGGDDAKLIAGGQSLMPLLNFRMARPTLLVDINGVTDLSYLREEGGYLKVGALTRHRELERQRSHPLLAEAARQIGHTAIRNRGTIGGSLVHADPTAELALAALLLDAELVIASQDGERIAAAAEFFLTYFTSAMGPDELLTEVRFPLLAPGTGWSFREVARRHGDFALVAVAATVAVDPDDRISTASIAVAGGGPTPLRATAAEQMLTGASASAQTLAAAADLTAAALEPDSDLHATAEFRRRLAAVLTREALQEAVVRSRGGAVS